MQNLVGKKPVAGQLTGLIINIAIDIWWFVNHGADFVFWLFITATILIAFSAVRTLSKSISVETHFVKVNKTEIPYSNISQVEAKGSFFRQDRVVIETIDGKTHTAPVSNHKEVAAAILANKGTSA